MDDATNTKKDPMLPRSPLFNQICHLNDVMLSALQSIAEHGEANTLNTPADIVLMRIKAKKALEYIEKYRQTRGHADVSGNNSGECGQELQSALPCQNSTEPSYGEKK